MHETASATTTATTSEAQVTQSDDDAAASSASEGIASTTTTNKRRSNNLGGSTSQPLTPTHSPAVALATIVDADVPYATVLYSSEGVVIRYVIRFANACGARWCVEKRYSDLLILHEALREQYESTRSLGTKISSFISSGNANSSSSSAPTAAANSKRSSTGGQGDAKRTPHPPSTSSSPVTSAGSSSSPTVGLRSVVGEDDNQRSTLMFPKFPGKAIGKATNQSIPFIISRRRDLSHYFTALVRNGCRTFIRTGGAQRTLCEFVRPPPTVLSPSSSTFGFAPPPNSSGGLYGAQSTTASESGYYFREDDDGFLSVEQKTYVYAYFSVSPSVAATNTNRGGGGASRECAAAAAWRKLAVTRHPEQHHNPHHMDDVVRIVPNGGGAGTGAIKSMGTASSSTGVVEASQRSVGGGDAQRPHAQHNRRQRLLDRNTCMGYIPTVTVCLPYARIVHDLFDCRRVVVALRCDRNEGRAEVMRRRDELVAFYRHIANGAVDRLPDVHEAKRFFVNYRRDNPLQEYGSVRLSASASSRDRLPATLPVIGPSFSSRKKLRRSPLDDDGEGCAADLSDVEDNVEAADDGCHDEEEDAMPSIVVSLASLRQTTGVGAGGLPLMRGTDHSGAAQHPQQQLDVERSLQASMSTVKAASATMPLGPASCCPSSSACSNSTHYVAFVRSEGLSPSVASDGSRPLGAATATSSTATSHTVIQPILDCTCTEQTLCAVTCGYNSARAEGPRANVAATTTNAATNTNHGAHHSREDGVVGAHEEARAVAFVGYKASCGYDIRVYRPTLGEHTRRHLRGGSPASTNASRAQSRQ